MQIGNLAVPDSPNRLPTLVVELDRIHRSYPKGIIRYAHKDLTLARIMGYSSTRNGSFWKRLSAMKHYGLLQGRPHASLTKLAERIVTAENERDRSLAYYEAVMNIALWRELYRRHQFNLPMRNLWRDIAEIAACDTGTARGIESFVRRAFEEDTSSIKNFSFDGNYDRNLQLSRGTGLIEIMAGPYHTRLEFTEAGLKAAVQFLQGIKAPQKITKRTS